MVDRGHSVSVVTQHTGRDNAVAMDGGVKVYRVIELEIEGGLLTSVAKILFGRERSVVRSVTATRRVMAEARPDIALMWGQWNVPRAVPAAVERDLEERVLYYICDYWPALPNAYVQRLREQARHRMAEWPKRMLAATLLPRLLREEAPELGLRHCACVSIAVRSGLGSAGVPMGRATIVRNGIDLPAWARLRASQREETDGLRLVYAGRLSPDKGLETVIEAMRLLQHRGRARVRLLILGDGERQYIRELEARARRTALPIEFGGFVQRVDMPAILARQHVLVLPSVWEEPFARILLEGMCAGLVVVATATGGTAEILRDGANGLTFQAGDAAALVAWIEVLASDPDLRKRLADAGREDVMGNYSIERTVDRLERELVSIASARAGVS